MAKTVSFDFKNVAGMASAEDIAAIKEEVVAAKSTLVNKTGKEMISLDGSIFRLIMIRKSSQESRKRLLRSSQIQMFW